jgi:hypothetical protein
MNFVCNVFVFPRTGIYQRILKRIPCTEPSQSESSGAISIIIINELIVADTSAMSHKIVKKMMLY